MTVRTSAGSTLAISSGTPATQDVAGFAALTYTTIGEITNLGELGKTFNVVKHNPVGNRRTQKFKGSYDQGTMALTMGRDVTDAGQSLLNTALASDASYACLLTLQGGHQMYFQAIVTDYKTNVGSVDQITAASTSLDITSDIFETN